MAQMAKVAETAKIANTDMQKKLNEILETVETIWRKSLKNLNCLMSFFLKEGKKRRAPSETRT